MSHILKSKLKSLWPYKCRAHTALYCLILDLVKKKLLESCNKHASTFIDRVVVSIVCLRALSTI